jgi:DNA-binding NtrC family response regulator
MIKAKYIKILVIEDEDYDVRRIQNTLKPFENRIKIQEIVSTGQAALDLLKGKEKKYDVIIMDFQIAGGLTGENLIKAIKEIDQTLQIIVITKMTINVTDFDFASKLLDAGAMWYCTKYPGDIEKYIYQPTDFILSIFNAFEKREIEKARLKSDTKLLQNVESLIAGRPIIGNSMVMKNLTSEIQRCAATDANILINGASGTGKELVATHIHYQSKRKFEKFVPINCGSLPQDLIESELFGYEKGSFTGATMDKQGLFEIAHKGTIFLDEIAELPKSAQVKLLRVIQEGELDKIGRTQKIYVDVRIVAASNKNLGAEVKEKRFREDLFYRLNVISIDIPPLKDRNVDIPLLMDHFLKYYSNKMNIDLPNLTEEARKILLNYEWPGNVRQLQNIVQRLLISGEDRNSQNKVLASIGDLNSNLKLGSFQKYSDNWDSENLLTWREMENSFKKEYFTFVREHSGSDSEAAQKLGLAPPNFHRMCKELGLK